MKLFNSLYVIDTIKSWGHFAKKNLEIKDSREQFYFTEIQAARSPQLE